MYHSPNQSDDFVLNECVIISMFLVSFRLLLLLYSSLPIHAYRTHSCLELPQIHCATYANFENNIGIMRNSTKYSNGISRPLWDATGMNGTSQ